MAYFRNTVKHTVIMCYKYIETVLLSLLPALLKWIAKVSRIRFWICRWITSIKSLSFFFKN